MRTFTLTALTFLGLGSGSLHAQIAYMPWGSPFGPSPIAPASFSPFGGPMVGSPLGGFGYGGYGMGGYGFGGYGYGGFPYGMWGTNVMFLPGFAAPETPRMRSTVYPAIPLPPREVIAAKLSGEDEDRATLRLTLPRTNALVWLDGTLMSQVGTKRHFVTPPLKEGDYVFNIRVEWTDEYGPQTRTRRVMVNPGSVRDLTIR